MNSCRFIVFEGPNGAGKSTIIKSVSEELVRCQIQVLLTKEPTTSDLGNYIRNKQNQYSKEVLACLVAANRYEHIMTTIRPSLQLGKVVLSDRYFPSSLVYQMMDGLDLSFIEGLNQKILIPDLTIFLMANESLLADRLKLRSQLTRFESSQKQEIELYARAISVLREKGWRILSLDSGNFDVLQITEMILTEIKGLDTA